MADTKELKRIKKIYGERFARLCRDMFPTILENEGILLSVLEKRFSHNCNSLYESITENHLEMEFKDLIYYEFDYKKEPEHPTEIRTPYEILDEAGYDLYECKTEKDIQSFKKYYTANEVLCTIYNGGRLKSRDCFFAVRKNVNEIKRENFPRPEKSDEYSTSVLGIQFTKEKNSTVQIISRYNHTVSNPNCTLCNDLDRLAPGLEQSFANLLKERRMNFIYTQNGETFEIPGYTLASDGKYYKYNMEIDGVYYCPGNIVISGGEARQIIAPEKGIVIDNYLLDLENKKIALISLYDQELDSFSEGLQNINKIQVETTKDKKSKIIKLFLEEKEDPVIIGIDNDNQIIRYENQYLQEVENDFLYNNIALTKIDLPQLQRIGKNFLYKNKVLAEISLPQLKQVEDDFLFGNKVLTQIDLPALQQTGKAFLYRNGAITKINLPKLQNVGEYFLCNDETLIKLDLPQLREVGNGFLSGNRILEKIDLPQLQQVGRGFLYGNEALTKIELPNLQLVESDFLRSNVKLKEIELPQLQQIEKNFLYSNETLEEINFPKLQKVGNDFLRSNKTLKKLNSFELQQVERGFLYSNKELEELNLPQLKKVDDDFLCNNETLTKLNLPRLQKVGNSFLSNNKILEEVNLPEVQEVGAGFLYSNRTLNKIDLPKLQRAGSRFLHKNDALTDVNLPQIPEVESKLKEVATRNQITKKGITPTDISFLDRENEITTSEIESAQKIIEKASHEFSKISKEEKDVSR